jgi:putative oxygen-independent coproporphyrinogen III oxidase
VHVVRAIPEQAYVAALGAELAHAAQTDAWRGRHVRSVFFGGGTPSLFGPASFESLLDAIDERCGLEAGAEISLEANPEDLVGDRREALSALRLAGVNRLSLGAQSFDARTLRVLGRMHTSDDAMRAIAAARDAGYDNLGCDLIFGAPGQSLEDWRADLDRLIALAPDHVSTYGLTYEPGTALTKRRDAGEIAPVSEDDERAMYETAIDVLTAAGYRHYEISNFARAGRESRHNLTDWSWEDYLGLGAGAHGFARTDPQRDGAWGRRYANVKPPTQYMELAPHAVETNEAIGREMAIAEFVMLGLRRIDGFEESAFEQAFGVVLSEVAPSLAGLVRAGLLARAGGRVALTREGLMVADAVTTRLADLGGVT